MARSRICFYTDEHVHRAVIRGLRQRGVDVLSVPDAGLLGASDEEHLSLARSEGRVLFTQDDDFLRLAAEGHPHEGIVYALQHKSVGEIVHGLMLIFQVLEPGDMRNHIEFL
jgi:predicted nuclease of predicted toxin-antitoxin system